MSPPLPPPGAGPHRLRATPGAAGRVWGSMVAHARVSPVYPLGSPACGRAVEPGVSLLGVCLAWRRASMINLGPASLSRATTSV